MFPRIQTGIAVCSAGERVKKSQRVPVCRWSAGVSPAWLVELSRLAGEDAGATNCSHALWRFFRADLLDSAPKIVDAPGSVVSSYCENGPSKMQGHSVYDV